MDQRSFSLWVFSRLSSYVLLVCSVHPRLFNRRCTYCPQQHHVNYDGTVWAVALLTWNWKFSEKSLKSFESDIKYWKLTCYAYFKPHKIFSAALALPQVVFNISSCSLWLLQVWGSIIFSPFPTILVVSAKLLILFLKHELHVYYVRVLHLILTTLRWVPKLSATWYLRTRARRFICPRKLLSKGPCT